MALKEEDNREPVPYREKRALPACRKLICQESKVCSRPEILSPVPCPSIPHHCLGIGVTVCGVSISHPMSPHILTGPPPGDLCDLLIPHPACSQFQLRCLSHMEAESRSPFLRGEGNPKPLDQALLVPTLCGSQCPWAPFTMLPRPCLTSNVMSLLRPLLVCPEMADVPLPFHCILCLHLPEGQHLRDTWIVCPCSVLTLRRRPHLWVQQIDVA